MVEYNKSSMKKYSNFIFVIIALCVSLLGNAQGKYILKSGDANGINKWYMGRQIAQVMSHRRQKQQPRGNQ